MKRFIMDAHSPDFSEVYDLYAKELYRFLYYKTGNQHVAEDLTSVTFMKALENYQRFQRKAGADVRSWLYTIARNAATDYYRTKKYDVPADESLVSPAENALAENLEKKLEREKLQFLLDKLTEEQREILIMRVYQELSYKEISTALSKSEASAKMSFSRALKELKKHALVLILFLMIVWQ